MIKDAFNSEGPVIGFLDNTGQLIALSVLWLLGCIPVITIASSTAALYYAVVKSVRRGQGSAVKEFWRSFRFNLSRGIPISATIWIIGFLLVMNFRIPDAGSQSPIAGGSLILAALLLSACVYIGPILSRFRMTIADVWKLAFVMSIRFIHYTVLLLLGAGIIAALQFYVLPVPMIVMLPGVCCFLATFPIEKALHCYMPRKDETDNAWYNEL